MQTEAIFENIAERIQEEISKGRDSIYIAVAWLTNKNLFNVLVNKAKSNCKISLIISNDSINLNSSINFDDLVLGKSKVFKIGNGEKQLMHNKFCIIDCNTVITGSYNWSNKAESNFENIIITSNDKTLAKQFIKEFHNICKQYYPVTYDSIFELPMAKIIRRLEIISNYIILEDIEELNKEILKLIQYDFNSDLLEIINAVKKEEFGLAINRIQNFISKNQQLSIWTDPIIEALKLELINLENQLNAYENEKVELEKILSDFTHQHTLELGKIILEIMKIQKIKFKTDKSKFKEIENEEKAYSDHFNTECNSKILELSLDQKLELKKKYRLASALCHPDKFANESKETIIQAEEIFKELNEANALNDLKKVSEILANLEKGILSTSSRNKITDKNKLQLAVNNLLQKVKKIKQDLIAIKQSETFITIKNIPDWNSYFVNLKEKLLNELENLKREIKY